MVIWKGELMNDYIPCFRQEQIFPLAAGFLRICRFISSSIRRGLKYWVLIFETG